MNVASSPRCTHYCTWYQSPDQRGRRDNTSGQIALLSWAASLSYVTTRRECSTLLHSADDLIRRRPMYIPHPASTLCSLHVVNASFWVVPEEREASPGQLLVQKTNTTAAATSNTKQNQHIFSEMTGGCSRFHVCRFDSAGRHYIFRTLPEKDPPRSTSSRSPPVQHISNISFLTWIPVPSRIRGNLGASGCIGSPPRICPRACGPSFPQRSTSRSSSKACNGVRRPSFLSPAVYGHIIWSHQRYKNTPERTQIAYYTLKHSLW